MKKRLSEEKFRNKYMILSCIKVLDKYKILFVQDNLVNIDILNFKGISIFNFQTFNDYFFKYFNNYGKWLNEKDREVILLLHLFDESRKVNNQINIA